MAVVAAPSRPAPLATSPTLASAPAPSRVELPSPPAARPVPVAPLTLNDAAELQNTWLKLLAPLPEASRVPVHDFALPLALTDGLLRIGVRKELWKNRLRELLGTLDLEALVPGLRRFEVIFEAAQGETGRETIAVADVERRAAARTAAESSEQIRRLLLAFDAEIEDVIPFVPADALAVPLVPELADDYAGAGGLDG